MPDQTQATAPITQGLAAGQLPARVYKYRGFDCNTQSLFENHSLWFSNPSSFNDPFDCQIREQGGYTRDDIFNYLVSRGGLPQNQAAQLADNHQRDPHLFPSLLESVKQSVIGSKGILSLSENRNNILMWSHYSNSHSGFVMGFDVASDIPFFTSPLHVRYETNYPAYRYLTQPDRIVSHGLLTKSSLWSYEQEIRVIKNRQGLHSFSNQALVEIVLGCRIEAPNRTRIFQYLGDYGYNHVVVSEATPSSSRYELEIRQIAIP
jgi:hypothetical protein